jgi:site-specific DNA-methyltransferase (adenine-specific)
MNKTTQKTLFSSKTGEWATPQEFFNKLDWRFGKFTLDPCATTENYKTKKYYTLEDNGLTQDWEGETVFVNPPYRNLSEWVEKGYRESQKDDTKVVMLIPARTDTKYWHNYVMRASEIHFIKGRLKFGDSKNSAPFPSAVVVFNSGSSYVRNLYPSVYTMERG